MRRYPIGIVDRNPYTGISHTDAIYTVSIVWIMRAIVSVMTMIRSSLWTKLRSWYGKLLKFDYIISVFAVASHYFTSEETYLFVQNIHRLRKKHLKMDFRIPSTTWPGFYLTAVPRLLRLVYLHMGIYLMLCPSAFLFSFPPPLSNIYCTPTRAG